MFSKCAPINPKILDKMTTIKQLWLHFIPSPGVFLRGQHNLAFWGDVYDAVLRKNSHSTQLDILRVV